jgi:hypothetical protein
MAAGFGADATMVVHFGVLFAFITADLAGHDAGVELGVDEVGWCFRLPHQNARSGGADVSAVEGGANAAPELLEVLGFSQARVGTGRARLGADGERVQCFGVAVGVLSIGARVAPQHHGNGFHGIMAAR